MHHFKLAEAVSLVSVSPWIPTPHSALQKTLYHSSPFNLPWFCFLFFMFELLIKGQDAQWIVHDQTVTLLQRSSVSHRAEGWDSTGWPSWPGRKLVQSHLIVMQNFHMLSLWGSVISAVSITIHLNVPNTEWQWYQIISVVLKLSLSVSAFWKCLHQNGAETACLKWQKEMCCQSGQCWWLHVQRWKIELPCVLYTEADKSKVIYW